MGLLDSLIGAATGQGNQGGDGAALVGALLQQLGGAQGLSGLVQRFSEGGLAELVQSWVGSGQNLPVSAAQIEQALGSGPLAELAQQFGVQPGQIAAQLAQQLPNAVDQLTPQGQLPDAAGLDDLLGQLGGLLRR